MLIGVDTGGTFTDFVALDGARLRFHKVLSTPDDPSRAILMGIREMGLSPDRLYLVHGSTVATNAILERKGVRTLFVTNRGLEDLITIGRQVRPELYELCPVPSPLWTDPDDCIGMPGRVSADGEVVERVAPADLEALAERARGYEAVAVCTLFSFLNPEQERLIGEVLPPDMFVSLSHEVLAEYREYERASTTFLNAYVGPLVQRYLNRLEAALAPKHLFVMHSAGGVMSVDEAGRQSVRMVLSGPAGGLVAARRMAEQLDISRLMTFDMGGTSTDVSLLDGRDRISSEASIAGLPVAVPMLDIHTIGAGGGSIAWMDAAGLLQVGPQSAGAEPGPVCYGQGGTAVTVTDANAVLGRIPSDARLAGAMPIDRAAAERVMSKMGAQFGMDAMQMADGVVRMAEAHMAGALRLVSVERGHDPREFALVCFGGAGGLHACKLADELAMTRVVLPLAGGAFSALGMLAGRRQCDLSVSRRLALADPVAPDEMEGLFADLERRAGRQMPGLTLHHERHADLRYEGQGFHLTLPWRPDMEALVRSFEQAHEQAYGHRLDRPVEAMTLRLTSHAETPRLELAQLPLADTAPVSAGTSEVYGIGEVPHYRRDALRPGHCLQGPGLIIEDTTTLWLASGWRLEVSEHGHLLLAREESQ
ncbi:MAG TPA: hydantoinase/oxoprolinase family protein [Mariprofundaceae bacterium]|nr:hydantoinase/oxoprolinase family protein [Mariprofundaceae bacterium]